MTDNLSRPFPAIQTSPFDEPAPVTQQRIEHDFPSIADRVLTRDEQIRDIALRCAVTSLPASYGQHTIILAIAASYESYLRGGARQVAPSPPDRGQHQGDTP